MSDTTTTPDARELAAGYFAAWQGRDFDTLRTLLADEVTFRGPLGTAANAEECLAGLRGLREIITDIVIQQVFVAGPDVLTWFDLHTTAAPPVSVANWSHTENGRITRIQVTFDPRDMLVGGAG